MAFTIDTLDNIFMLTAAIIGLLVSLFRYIERPERRWLYLSVFFLADLLSDYYWTIYSVVMHESPDVSALMAYFGWNAGYLILLLAVIRLRTESSRSYFHLLMLLPIPLNMVQFSMYLSFGGFINNLWQCGITTAIACFCIQALLYYRKNKDKGEHFPHLHTVLLLYVFTQYGQWTASCYEWESELADPYYYFSFAGYVTMLFFSRAAAKDCRAEGMEPPAKDAQETRSQGLLQMIVTAITIGCCIIGFYLSVWMRESLEDGGEAGSSYGMIARILFLISVFMVLLILAVISIVAQRYALHSRERRQFRGSRRSRRNLILTLLITFLLMIVTVIYNSMTIYRTSVSGMYDTGADRAKNLSADMDNYLIRAMSTLKVSADTIELMQKDHEPVERIREYILEQTAMQKEQLDENFTGLYAYIRGEYLDGLGWEPPADYDASARDWYRCALEGEGEVVIVSPYVDAQTDSVVITITKMLADGENRNVVSLDVITDHIQESTEAVNIGGNGYAMIINRDGFIVAHRDPDLVGEYFQDLYGQGLLQEILSGQDRLEAEMTEKDSTLFLSTVSDRWYVAVVVDNADLFEEVYSQLLFNVLVSLTIFALITFFYYLGYMNEQSYSRQMEEMTAIRQKQEYEAEVLRLEKSSADEANKAKSKFLADMSHEIRTPINAILGMNEMILREAGDEGLLEYARNIDISGRNLLQLINSILDFSKIEDGKMDIVPVSYQTGDLITYLVRSIREKAADKGLDLSVEVDPHIPSGLYGDNARINQVILNLLTNAVKYTPQGSVTLRIQMKEQTEAGALLHVEVEDTGIGIRACDMGRLFESFERLDEKKNYNIEGTGLGISISTSLLRLMGSELQVESEYGKGSTFFFDLLQKVTNDTPIGEYRVPAAGRSEAEDYRESFRAPEARILIVDDTKLNITVAVNLLKKTRIRIDAAQNGEEAVALAKENAYDLILMDQRMPGMNGTQALLLIRALENRKNTDTPVICLTADAIRGARERYIAEGFTDYLTKPIDGRSLERALLSYLPKEKVLTVSAEDEGAAADAGTAAGSWLDILRTAGIDTACGLMYCMEEEEVYREILTEYIAGYEERRDHLAQYVEEKDWEDYSILIHSLKSSSKTIGAMELSAASAALEKASKEQKEEEVLAGHPDAMRQYDGIVQAIRDAIASADGKA